MGPSEGHRAHQPDRLGFRALDDGPHLRGLQGAPVPQEHQEAGGQTVQDVGPEDDIERPQPRVQQPRPADPVHADRRRPPVRGGAHGCRSRRQRLDDPHGALPGIGSAEGGRGPDHGGVRQGQQGVHVGAAADRYGDEPQGGHGGRPESQSRGVPQTSGDGVRPGYTQAAGPHRGPETRPLGAERPVHDVLLQVHRAEPVLRRGRQDGSVGEDGQERPGELRGQSTGGLSDKEDPRGVGVHRGRRVLEQEGGRRDRHRRHGLADEEGQAHRGQTQPGETRHGKARKEG